MLYECTNPIRRIIGVPHLSWEAQTVRVNPKGHAALSFRVKGDAALRCGTETCFVAPHEILYMPQKLAYEADYSDTEMFAIHFLTEADDRQAEIYSVLNVEEMYRMFYRGHQVWQKKEAGYEAEVMALTYRILAEAARMVRTEKTNPAIMTVVSYINEHFTDPELDAQSICKAAGIGETTFRQMFKSTYGKTPVTYITERRLEYAGSLITAGATIERAALESGFRDSKYFARVVKKVYGCTPRELKLYGK